MVSGSDDPVVVVRPWCPSAQRARIVTDGPLELVEALAGGGNGMPYAACSRSNQPGADPTKARPPVSADSVAAAFAVTPARRKVTGVQRVPRSQPGVERRRAPERDPRLGDRVPGPADLGDLDQVVHQRQPGEARLVRGEGDAGSQASGSSPHGKRET